MNERIYLSPPHLCGQEFRFLYEAFHSNWIAPLGKNVTGFEKELCELASSQTAAALSSGTAGVFLGLKALGVAKGDRVFCSDLTFAGSSFPITYLGAEPVFIDSEPQGCNMSPAALETALKDAAEHHCLPKAVEIVDLYGNPAEYDRLLPLCEEYGVPVLEDAAEALGSSMHGKKCGTFGEIGVFSFNGNKIVTTSGGGAVVSGQKDYIEKIRFWATQSREPVPYYEHREIGYNFRLSNICAGIGRGQLTVLEDKIRARRRIHQYYSEHLKGYPLRLIEEPPDSRANCWLSVMLLEPGCKVKSARIIDALESRNIESRRLWKPMHDQPVFRDCAFYPTDGRAAVGSDLFDRGVCLPSGEMLCDGQLAQIVEIIRACF